MNGGLPTTRRNAPKPWDEVYRRQGRLWRGGRLDGPTRALLDAMPGLARGHWLDAGCGDGKGLAPLSRLVDRIEGTDASRWALRRAAETDARVPLLQADAVAWPLRTATFDAVRAVHLLGHLGEAAFHAALGEIRRVLRPGGTAVLVDFGRGDFRHGAGEEIAPSTFRRGAGIVTRYFEPGEYEELVARAGLVPMRVSAERFTVRYEGKQRTRERVWAWARA